MGRTRLIIVVWIAGSGRRSPCAPPTGVLIATTQGVPYRLRLHRCVGVGASSRMAVIMRVDVCWMRSREAASVSFEAS